MEIQEVEGIGWCLIPPWIMSRDDLTSTQKLLYGRIQGLVDKKGYCFASNRWLAKQMNLTSDRVSEILSEMRSKDIIEIDIIRNDINQVVERRIYLSSPLPGKNRVPPPEQPNTSSAPPRTNPPTSPDESGEGYPQENEAQKEMTPDFEVGSVENSVEKNILITNSASGAAGGNGTLAVRRLRSNPIPEPVQQKSKRESNPSFAEGSDIMRNSGLWKLLRKVRNSSMPSGQEYFFQQSTLIGQMVVKDGIEKDRINKVVNWLFDHYQDEFVPQFFTPIEFKDKFFKLEYAMKKASRSDKKASQQISPTNMYHRDSSIYYKEGLRI